MAYILRMGQFEREHTVGIFESEVSIKEFIRLIPFVVEVENSVDDYHYTDFMIPFDALPISYLVTFKGAQFLITKYMFLPNEDIYFNWEKAHEWDNFSETNDPTVIDGSTIVDAYSIPNGDAFEYIIEREALADETLAYFTSMGKKAIRDLQGSQDGEVISLIDGENSRILFTLDQMAMNERNKHANFASFIAIYLVE